MFSVEGGRFWSTDISLAEIRMIVKMGVYCAIMKRLIPTEALLWLQNGIGWFLLREYTGTAQLG